jgi:hypothetical protein
MESPFQAEANPSPTQNPAPDAHHEKAIVEGK